MSVSEGQQLEVSFDIGPEDYVAFNRYWAETSTFAKAQLRRARITFTIAFVIMGALVAGLAYLGGDEQFAIIFAVVLAAVLLLYLLILGPRWVRAVARNARKQYQAEGGNQYLFGPRRYSFDQRGFRFASPNAGGYVLWSAVKSVERGDQAAYLMLAASQSHVLPRRAFVNPADFENLLGWIDYWRAMA